MTHDITLFVYFAGHLLYLGDGKPLEVHLRVECCAILDPPERGGQAGDVGAGGEARVLQAQPEGLRLVQALSKDNWKRTNEPLWSTKSSSLYSRLHSWSLT